jgi:lantibiotic biosynthesis protein
LLLASPELFTEFKRYVNEPFADPKKVKKLENTLLKYYIRLTSRSTPFGLFAGYSPVTISDRTSIEFESPEKYKRNARLDMNYLYLLLDKISKDSLIKPHCKFYPNSSIYKSGDNLRYVEYAYIDNKRVHNLVGITTNEYLDKILLHAENGITITRAQELILDEEITSEIAFTFIDYLIANQILISEFEPIVTGKNIAEYTDHLLLQVRERAVDQDALDQIEFYRCFLRSVQEQLSIINENKTNDNLPVYDELKQVVKSIDVPFEEKHLIQVDLHKSTRFATLDAELIKDIFKGLEIFCKFSPRFFRSSRTSQTNYQAFKRAFEGRYDTREVDLCEALDGERGIGYIQHIKEDADYSAILRNINVPPPKDMAINEIAWDGQLHSFWLRKFLEATGKNSYEIKLSEEDLEAFPSRLDECGETLSVMAALLSTEGESGPNLQVIGVTGTSASKLLARFGTSSEEIDDLLQEITNKEAELNSSAIVAEIVHLPEEHFGNVLLRPANRRYEIPYLAKATVDKAFQIPVNDITISLQNDRIILRSKKTGKEIIPRLSNAHNFSYNSLPIYQFLCDMEAQRNLTDIYLNLGIVYNIAVFYPRVSYKNIIIKPATWLFRKGDLESLFKGSPEEQIIKFTELCEKFKVPRYVCWMVRDNALLIDTNNRIFSRMLLRELQKRDRVMLTEFLHSIPDASADKKTETYSNEIIVSFYRNSPKSKNESISHYIQDSKVVKRKFTIGDEWLFFKLYTGLKTAENSLIKGVKPFITELFSKASIEKWFFIRYSDPDYHIRLRIQAKDKDRFQYIIQTFKKHFKPFEDSQEIWKVQTDTYGRELERYGSHLIEEVETIFFYDSNFCLDMLTALHGDEGERYRWQIALKSVDSYLNSFKYSLEEKIEVITKGRDAFAIEFNSDKNLRSSLSRLYKTHQKNIELLFGDTGHENNIISTLDRHLSEREVRFEKPASIIIQASTEQSRLNHWMLQYTHMNINRIFKSKQRLHEYVIYDLLLHYYKSAKNRSVDDRDRLAPSHPAPAEQAT